MDSTWWIFMDRWVICQRRGKTQRQSLNGARVCVCVTQTCSGRLQGPSGRPASGEPTPSFPECHPARLEFHDLARRCTGSEKLCEFPVSKNEWFWPQNSHECTFCRISSSNWNAWRKLKWEMYHSEINTEVSYLEQITSTQSINFGLSIRLKRCDVFNKR